MIGCLCINSVYGLELRTTTCIENEEKKEKDRKRHKGKDGKKGLSLSPLSCKKNERKLSFAESANKINQAWICVNNHLHTPTHINTLAHSHKEWVWRSQTKKRPLIFSFHYLGKVCCTNLNEVKHCSFFCLIKPTLIHNLILLNCVMCAVLWVYVRIHTV